jgi:hypothetical protein
MKECCCGTLSSDAVNEIERMMGVDGKTNQLVYVLAFDSYNNISTIKRDGVKVEPLSLPTDNTQITSIQSASFGSYTGSRYHWKCVDGEMVRITHPNHPK